MNVQNHDFTESLEQAALRISIGLRLQSGLDTDTRIENHPGKTIMVFSTDDTNSRTLRQFLSEIMNEAAKQSCRQPACHVDIEDFPCTNQRGAVAVALTPQLQSCLIAKL